MDGSATLMIEKSSTTMNCAIESANNSVLSGARCVVRAVMRCAACAARCRGGHAGGRRPATPEAWCSRLLGGITEADVAVGAIAVRLVLRGAAPAQGHAVADFLRRSVGPCERHSTTDEQRAVIDDPDLGSQVRLDVVA